MMMDNISGKILTSMLIISSLFVILPGLIAAFLFRGGILTHFFGLAFVTNEGLRAERWRVFLRNLLMWCPVYSLGIYVFTFMNSPLEITFGVGVGVGLYALLTLINLITPSRSLQDRLVGTWIVPR